MIIENAPPLLALHREIATEKSSTTCTGVHARSLIIENNSDRTRIGNVELL